MRCTAARNRATAFLSLFILAACGGGGGGSYGGGGNTNPPTPPTPTSFTIGGTVTGLASSGLVLSNNGGDALLLSSSGTFTFAMTVATGSAYSVTISSQPNIGPLQVCTLTNGSGSVAGAAVTSVAVDCVTKTAKFLYVPNQTAGTVSAYTINASTGFLTAVAGSPFATEPAPRFATADASGKFLYVTTLGSSTNPPRISGYALNGTSGVLTELDDSPFDLSSTPPPPSSTFVTAPAVHTSGAFGYLTVWNPSPSPTVNLYGATIDSTTGDLAQIAGTPLPVGYDAQTPVLEPTGKFAFLARDTAPNSSGEIMSFNISSPSGVLTANGATSTGGNRPIAALTFDGKFVLVSNAASGTFVVMTVDSAGVVAMKGSPIATGAAGTSPGVPIYSRRFGVVYLANAPLSGGSVPSLAAYHIDNNGVLTMLAGSPYSSNGATLFPLPHPSGKFLYQVNGSTGSLQRYSLDSTGVPTLVADVTTPMDSPTFLVPDPSGNYLYVTSGSGGSVSSYSVDHTTGALTLVNTVAAGAGAFLPQPVGLQ